MRAQGHPLKQVVLWLALFLAVTLVDGEAAERGKQVFFISGTAEALSAGRATVLQPSGGIFLRQLPLSKSEVWRIPTSEFPSIQSKLQRLGITSSKVTAEGTEATLPTSHDHMNSGQSSMLSDAKNSMAIVDWCVVTLPKPEVMEYLLTQGDEAADKKPYTLTIALRADLSVRARQRSVRRIGGGYVWHGVIESTGEPVTLIWRSPSKLSGQVYWQRHQYVFRNLGAGKFAIVEIDPKMMPAEHPAMSVIKTMPGAASEAIRGEMEAPERPRQPALRKNDFKNSETGGGKIELAFETQPPSPTEKSLSNVTIDVMVAYTAKAAAHYIDIKDELIDLAIEEANQSFISSGVRNVQLRLVHTYRTGYVESGTHFDHVFRLADKGDGYMDEVHDLRNKYRADIVVLIVDDANGCGLAAGVAPDAEHAFAVVHYECAAATYSLAHEIGHILGARHDVALDDGATPYSYGHGYIFGNKWRTIMSYGEDCGGCPRLPLWSNPLTKVGGVPAGDLLANNARVIESSAMRVASFR